MVTEILKYDNVKTLLCQDWRKRVDTEQNPENCIYGRRFTSGK
jgi:hypothetical protein